MTSKSQTFLRRWLASLASGLLFLSVSAQAQTTPNVKVEILGIGAESLLGYGATPANPIGPVTDPEWDGLDELGGATDPSWNWVEATASIEPDFEGGENSFNIFDHKVGATNDKWCCDDPTADNPVWVAVQLAKAVSITHFTVASGNDSPDRDPTDWAIQGSNDGTTYTDIYHFTDTTVPWTDRNQVVKFTLPSASPLYKYLRYIAWETPGTLHQINEIEYYGTSGTPTDTDGDGMPDSYETDKGFNPNDPSDAAKDFDGDGVSNLDEYKAGTDPIDTTKPTLVSASTTPTLDTVKLTFSEELNPATATNLVNYTISPTLAVTAASYSKKVVTLTTAKQAAGGTNYTVAIKGVTDTSKNEVAAGTQASVFSHLLSKAGVGRFSYWGGIDTTAVDALTSDPRYPATPDLVAAVYSLNSRDAFPDDSHENYGATIDALLTPTEAASYDFFLRSDDASQLWISTDDKEANLALVAEETGCCNAFMEPGAAQTSTAPIALTAGKSYFVRVIYKEGGGGDYGQAAWRKVGDTTPAASLLPIPGKFLTSPVDLAVPAEGSFTTQAPAANAKKVSPVSAVTIGHRDGKTEWTAANTSMKFDGTTVTPTFVKDGSLATITYQPSGLLPSKSSHTVALSYVDAAGKPATLEWQFETAEYKGPIKDSVAGYQAIILGAAKLTADKGGFSGKAGDLAVDYGKASGQSVLIPDAKFLNAPAAGDKVTFTLWAQKYDIAASSAFWADSPSSSSSQRGFQAHIPWSDNTVYFDTAGCCGADTQRINAGIDSFADYSGDQTWWNTWRHYAFVKNAGHKQVWIDGKLFLEGDNSNPLPTDFTEIWLGAEGGGPSAGIVNFFHGLEDDFAIFGSALVEADIKKLAAGDAPTSLPATTKLVAYWNFNDAGGTPPGASFTAVTLSADKKSLVLTYTGTLQSADVVGGPYTDVPNATSPTTVTIAGANKFYRVH